MTVLIFTRFTKMRNLMNIDNFGTVRGVLNIIQRSDVISKSYSTDAIQKIISDKPDKFSERKINKAMKVYLERSKEYKQFMEKQITEYNIGKRHLAKIIGEDPDNFTEADINKAITYLFPSGLYDKQAKPMMIDPTKMYETRKEAEFDEAGRPHHFLFYTLNPKYYEVLHEIVGSLNRLDKIEDQMLAKKIQPSSQDKLDIVESQWIGKPELEKILGEEIKDKDFEYFIKSMDRLIQHPVSKHAESFIMKFRKKLLFINTHLIVPKPEYDSDNRPFILVEKCARKNARGHVKVIGNGSGKITINGKDITSFNDIQCREQILFPLIFTDMCDKVDIEAEVFGGGPTGQAGTIRWGIAQGLRSFVDQKMIEKMRIAGLLTRDWRKRERKKWGQEGARRKFTWKKR